MVSLAGKPATYDIQLKGDANGLVDMMTIYKVFAPLNADFIGIFGTILSQLDVPGEPDLRIASRLEIYY